jgi:hypothetical protein
MKRRTFLKSLAASVAGLFCASPASSQPELADSEYRTRTRAELARRLRDPEFKTWWVQGGGMTLDEVRAIEAKYPHMPRKE